MQPRRRGDGIWAYPHLEEAMEEIGFKEIRKYTTRRNNTIVQYIATQPILDLFERTTRRLGARMS